MVRLSIGIMKLLIQKLKDGWAQGKIAIQFNISRDPVQHFLLKFKIQKHF